VAAGRPHARGARVIAAASTAEGRALALDCGAEAAVDSRPEGLRVAVRAATGGVGVDAALDPVGGDSFAQALRCLRPGGRILPIGFAGGTVPRIPANLLLVKNATVCGLYMGYYKIDAPERFEPQVRALFSRLGAWFEEGAIRPRIAARLRLKDVRAAFRLALDRGTPGHVVLTPG